MTTANIGVNAASNAQSRAEMPSSQERLGRKDEAGSASDDQQVMSIFFNVLQHSLSVMNSTENAQSGSFPKCTSFKDTSRKECNAAAGSQEDKTDDSGAVKNSQSSNSQIMDFLRANGLTLEELEKLLTSESDSGKQQEFLKNLTAWLKKSGLEDSRIEQILSQIKNVTVSAGDGLLQNSFQKDLAGLLKGQGVRDKEVLSMQGGAKGNSGMYDGQFNMAETGDDQSKLFAMFSADNKTGFTINGTDMYDSAASGFSDVMNMVKMPDDDIFSLNNGLTADQKQTSLFAGNNEGTGRTAYLPNLRPQELIEQIVQNRQIMEKGSGRVRMTLNPPSLGTLDMDVRVKNNRVEVTMTADNREVKQILQANLDELKTALKEQGLSVERLNIQWQTQNGGQGDFNFSHNGSSPGRDGRNVSRQAGKTDEDNSLQTEEYPLNVISSVDGGTRLISVII